MYWVASQKGIISSLSHAINFDSWLVCWEWWPPDIIITLTLKMGRARTWEQHAIGIMLDWAVHTSHSMCKGAGILVTEQNFHVKANYVVYCLQYPCLWWCKMLHHYITWCESHVRCPRTWLEGHHCLPLLLYFKLPMLD